MDSTGRLMGQGRGGLQEAGCPFEKPPARPPAPIHREIVSILPLQALDLTLAFIHPFVPPTIEL